MDEHREVGTVSVAGSSTVTVAVCRSDETLVENVGGEGQGEGSYNEGDGNEIMVEVVGSDVFVDGMSGDGDRVGKEGLAGSGMESFGNDDVGEGKTGSREVGDFEGRVWEDRTETGGDEEVVRASGERAEVGVAMEGAELVPGSTSEETHVLAEKVQVTVTPRGEEKREDMEKLVDGGNNAFGGSAHGGVSDDETWNPGIDAMAGSSSPMHASEGRQQEFSAEEGAVKVQLSCKVDEVPGAEDRPGVEMNETISEACAEDGANHAGSTFSDHFTEDAVKGNIGVVSIEETSKSRIDVTGTDVADQNLHSSGENQQMKDNPAGMTAENLDVLDKDSPSSFKIPNGSTCEISVINPEVSSTLNNEVVNNVPANSSGRDGGEEGACTDSGSSDLVRISPDQSAVHDSNNSSFDSGSHLPSSGEVLASEPRFTGGPTDDLDVGEHEMNVKPVNDLVLGSEPKDAVGETEVAEQDENLGSTGKDLGAEPEASDGPTGDFDVGGDKVEGGSMSDVLATKPDHAVVDTQGVAQDEDTIGASGGLGFQPEACDDNKIEDRSYSEDLPGMNQETTNTGGGDVHAIPESSHGPSSVVERGEWIGMDIDEVLDFKDEATDLDASVGNLTVSVNAENVSGQEIRSADGVHIAEFRISDVETNAKDSHILQDPVQSEFKPSREQQQVAAGDVEGITGKEGADSKDSHILQDPVQSEFKPSREHQPVAAGDVEGVAGNKGADSNEEVLDRDVSPVENKKLDIGEKEVTLDANAVSSNEQIGLVTPMELVESQGVDHIPDSNADDGKSSQLAEGNDLKDEKVGVSIREDASPGNFPPKGAEAGLLDTSVQGMDSNIETSYSIQEKKQDEACALEEVPMDKVDLDQSKDKFVDDKVSNEGAANSPIADVQASAGSQSTVVCNDFCGEGNKVSSLPDGVQISNVIGVTEDTSVLTEDQTVETSVSEIATSGEANQVTEREDECFKTDDHNSLLAVVPEAMYVDDQPVAGVSEQNDYGGLVDNGEQDMVIKGHASETEQLKILEKEMLKPSSSSSIYQSGYLLPPENEVEFSASDLVWGKVRSHPWWPGQIFDPADASDKAVKYYKKDCFLVAYFGDRTFAWNDASVLKPFRLHFSQIEKQSNSEAFQNAVSSALDEISRRVVLGLSCSCIPRDAYERIECQVVENTGICEESSRRYGVDKSFGATFFEPDKLLQHIRLLAQSPFSMADRLELTLANAQLSAFCRFKGYRPPPTFVLDEESLENAAGTTELSSEPDHMLPVAVDGEQVPSETSTSLKRKLSLKDNLQPKKKERSLSELMGDAAYSPDEEDDLDGKALSKSVSTSSGKKRKAGDPVNDGSDRRISIYAAKVSTTSSIPKPSFKVGECIRRIASQLTGSASILKGNDQQGSDASLHVSENSQRGNMVFPTDISLEEMLSQLQLAARDPKKGYSFLNNIILFFSVFRNSVVMKHASGRSGGGRKRKASNAAGGSTEEFEFDDVNDSYWTDRIVHNYPEEQLLQNGENGDEDYPLVVSDQDKVHKASRRSYSRKQYSNGNYETSAEETVDIERRKLSPAELVLTFAEGDSLPSEINLNKMFRRFGPLKESETEVDQDSHRARVVFKKGSDAEVAHSSAATFKIFGSKLVSYQLSYSPSTAFRVLPPLISQGQEDAP